MTTEGLAGASWETDDFDVDAYLDRVGVRRGAPDLAMLERLHHAHVHTLPFTNVDVLLGQHPGVDPATVQRRLVSEGRGGYCFEHAQLFAAVLEDLGYLAERRLGRVGSPASGRTHTTVAVTLGAQRYLTDPGFGFSITGPIPLEGGAIRVEGDRRYTIEHGLAGEVSTWSLRRDGELQHVVDALPVQPVDVRNGHLVTSTDSVFTRTLMAMRYTENGHITVTPGVRTVRPPGQETRRDLLDPAETVEAVKDLGVRLVGDEPVRLRDRIEKIISADPQFDRR